MSNDYGAGGGTGPAPAGPFRISLGQQPETRVTIPVGATDVWITTIDHDGRETRIPVPPGATELVFATGGWVGGSGKYTAAAPEGLDPNPAGGAVSYAGGQWDVDVALKRKMQRRARLAANVSGLLEAAAIPGALFLVLAVFLLYWFLVAGPIILRPH